MPYVKQEVRKDLDPLIDQIVRKIGMPLTPSANSWAGELNYVITRIATKVSGTKSYWTIALVMGVFITAALEYYRRVAAPYEDSKIEENGDVY